MPASKLLSEASGLRRKSLVILGVTQLCLLMVLYAVAELILEPRFLRLETQQAEQDGERAVDALRAHVAALVRTAEDLGQSQQTCQSMGERHGELAVHALGPHTMVRMRVNVLALALPSGHLVHAEAVDLVHGTPVPPPVGLQAWLTDHLAAAGDAPGGLVQLDGVPLALAVQPVVNPQAPGTIRGWVVVAQVLDDGFMEALGNATGLMVSLHLAGNDGEPADVQVAAARLSADRRVTSQVVDDEYVAAYVQLRDVRGRPAMVLKYQSPRRIHALGRLAVSHFLQALLATALMLNLVVFLMLERLVLSRLRRIGSSVQQVRRVGDLSRRVDVPEGRDELSLLAISINHMLGAMENTQQALRQQDALRESESRYRQLIELSPDAVFIHADGCIRYANAAAMRMLGAESVGQVLGTPLARWVHVDSRGVVDHDLRQVTGAGNATDFREVRYVRRDGTAVDVEEIIIPYRHHDGPAAQVVARDITGRKRAQQAHDRLAMAVEQSRESILITDTTPIIQYVNPAFERLSGWSAVEVLGRPVDLLDGGKQDCRFQQEMERALAEGIWSGKFTARRRNGTPWENDVVISPLRDPSGEVVAYVATLRDVTEERNMEAQLRQAQKMEAVGRLAGGVAHDFNNLLSVILGYGDLLLHDLKEGQREREAAKEIVAAGERAAGLTRQLLAFSRKQVLQPRKLDLNGVVTGMGKLLKRLMGEDIELRTELAHELWQVQADPGQLEQVIANFCVNARDAMPRGGRLTITTANVLRKGGTLYHGGGEVPEGEYVELSVLDTGCGMTREVQAHLFEPFFTTKEVGKGTGLGLSTVYGIIKQSGGFIEVDSKVGRGSRFSVLFPRATELRRVSSSRLVIPRPLTGAETVLLVEDEDAVRTLAQRVLEPLGYNMLVATRGDEALTISESHRGDINLLLTDVVMPGMTGRELADRLRPNRHETKVLYMSGYTDDVLLGRGFSTNELTFLPKPFSAERLATKVREVLDG